MVLKLFLDEGRETYVLDYIRFDFWNHVWLEAFLAYKWTFEIWTRGTKESVQDRMGMYSKIGHFFDGLMQDEYSSRTCAFRRQGILQRLVER